MRHSDNNQDTRQGENLVTLKNTQALISPRLVSQISFFSSFSEMNEVSKHK
jgi:hypothetical protein